MDLLEKMKKAQETKISTTEKNSVIEKSKKQKQPKKKRIGISERKLNKRQTLDVIYNLGKENIDSITDIKLKSILEDIKVYSRRK